MSSDNNNYFLSGFFSGRFLRAGANNASVFVPPAMQQDFFNGLACGLVDVHGYGGNWKKNDGHRHLTDFWEWVEGYGGGSFPTSWAAFQADAAQVVEDNSSIAEAGSFVYEPINFVVNNSVPIMPKEGYAADYRSLFSTTVTNGGDGTWETTSTAITDIPGRPESESHTTAALRDRCATIASGPFTMHHGSLDADGGSGNWYSNRDLQYYYKSVDVYQYVGGEYVKRARMELSAFQYGRGEIEDVWSEDQTLENCYFVPIISFPNISTSGEPAGYTTTAQMTTPLTILHKWTTYYPAPNPMIPGPLATDRWGEELYCDGDPLFRFDVEGERVGLFRTADGWKSIKTCTFSWSGTDDMAYFRYAIRTVDNSNYTVTFYKDHAQVNSLDLYYPASETGWLRKCVRVLMPPSSGATNVTLQLSQTTAGDATINWGDGTVEVTSGLTGSYAHSYAKPANSMSRLITIDHTGENKVSLLRYAGARYIEYYTLEGIPDEFAKNGDLYGLIVHMAPPEMSIGDSAFWFSRRVEMEINSRFSRIGDNAFYYGYAPAEQLILAKDAVIGEYAFRACNGLQHMAIPDGTRIGNYAFATPNLTLTMPEEPGSIGEHCFDGTQLASVVIGRDTELPTPVSWTSMFSGARYLTEINISPQRNDYSSMDGIVYSKDEDELIFCPPGKSGKLVIDCETIAVQAFNYNSGITTVWLRESVQNTGVWSLAGSTGSDQISIYLEADSLPPGWNANTGGRIARFGQKTRPW